MTMFAVGLEILWKKFRLIRKNDLPDPLEPLNAEEFFELLEPREPQRRDSYTGAVAIVLIGIIFLVGAVMVSGVCWSLFDWYRIGE